MKLYDTNKEVFTFSQYNFRYNRNLKQFYNSKPLACDKEYISPFKQDSYHYCLFVPEDFDLYTEVNKKLAKSFAGVTLYFTKNSKFPRFKLSDTDYKRCIKIEKADVIVLPDIEKNKHLTTYRSKYRIYEDKKAYYAIQEYDYKQLFVSDSDFLNTLNQYGRNFKFEYVKTISRFITFDKDILDYIDLIHNKFTKPVITDNMLDIKLSTTLPTLTESDVDSINSMLASSDKSVQELGLKMLTGFNVFETPTLIKALIMSNYNICANSIKRGGVAVQKMLNGIDFPRDYVQAFPGWIPQLLNEGDKYSDFEQQQIKKLVIPKFKQIYENLISRYKIEDSPFVPKINITFE